MATTTEKKTTAKKAEYGIKETTDLIKFVGGMAHSLAGAKADGKIHKGEAIALIIKNAKNFPAAIVGIDKVPNELKDLDAAEVDTLRNELSRAFNVKGAQANELLTASFDMLKIVLGLYK